MNTSTSLAIRLLLRASFLFLLSSVALTGSPLYADKGKLLKAGTGPIRAIDFSPSGDSFVTAADGKKDTYRIVRWETKTGRKIGVLQETKGEAIISLCHSPDGKSLFTSCGSELHVWNLNTKKFEREKLQLEFAVPRYSSDGKLFVMQLGTAVLSIYDGKQRKLKQPIVGGYDDKAFMCFAISPDSKRIAVAQGNGWIQLFRSQTELAVSPDGKTKKGRSRFIPGRVLIGGHEGPIISVAFLNKKDTLVSVGMDGLVFWSFAEKMIQIPGKKSLVPVIESLIVGKDILIPGKNS